MKFRFRPVASSWVALHPQPKGVIQFIAGAFFGTFGPMFFYRHLLKYLFDQGYTIILLPFNFTFDHYREAGFLIRQQYEILPEIIRMAKVKNYDYEAYLDDKNFSWIGHSVGCKYISLIEGFSALPEDEKEREEFIRNLLSNTSGQFRLPRLLSKNYQKSQIESVIKEINILVDDLNQKIAEIKKIIYSYVHRELKINNVFIKGQKSILLAPVISDTASAIRPRFLANLVDALGLGVKPTPEETKNLIKESHLFNRMGLIRFKSDNIAQETTNWFLNTLRKPPAEFGLLLDGGHLRPLGIRLGKDVFNPFNLFKLPIFEPIQKRNKEFEDHVRQLFDKIIT